MESVVKGKRNLYDEKLEHYIRKIPLKFENSNRIINNQVLELC